jgi:hypothetical protein
MSALIDLTGQTFGRLSVIGRVEDHAVPSGQRFPKWLCVCECGIRVRVLGLHLRSGNSNSCGCLQRDMAAEAHAQMKGDQHPSWQGDEIGYGRAHSRVRDLRGPASKHVCVGCGDRAEDWSYVGGCPRERIAQAGKGKGCAYSPDPDRYEPRCKPCHKKYDQAMRDAA